MNIESKKATLLGIYGNIVLFILKIIIGLMYNSIAVISDSFNSFTDTIASIIVYISVKISGKSADKDHPFGHHRAEPIAALIVAIFTGILGFGIINIAFSRLLSGSRMVISIAPIIVMAITLLMKYGMYLYTVKIGNKLKSTAILASAVDHRNDVWVSIAALIGVGGAYMGYAFLDPLVALIIGAWIIKAGYNIGKNNIRFLIGEAPSKELMDIIKEKALSIRGVKGIHYVRAHYVGVLLHVEIHIQQIKRRQGKSVQFGNLLWWRLHKPFSLAPPQAGYGFRHFPGCKPNHGDLSFSGHDPG